jgi:3'-phosphoadenosine 5'-phosphosulfate sulfotransferase (PAPS reductase)/FAD synthetase
MIVSWFSAGITSAVACKLALEKYEDVRICYIETGNHHSDNLRFLADCEKWYGQEIEILRSKKYENVQDVILTDKYINSPYGAPCTNKLKKQVRRDFHNRFLPSNHVMGFEFDNHEIKRAERFSKRHSETNPLFPLIEEKLNKNECAGILKAKGIKLPVMYHLGYEHNNCVGCVKGGKGYWNKIRRDFPNVFNEFALLEREVGASCINGTYLDELEATAGNPQRPIMPNCGIFCTFKFL